MLASWALAAIDALDDDVDRPCYFSMTGGAGTVGLWGWHAASELAVHCLDIQNALGLPYSMTDDLACDAIDYACQFFVPAMARLTESSLGTLEVAARRGDLTVHHAAVATPAAAKDTVTTLRGNPTDILLALWGRPHGPVEIDGSRKTADSWFALPSTAFQFGTWD